MNDKLTDKSSHKLLNLVNTIKALRGEKGCPWDRKQTTLTLKKYIQEEVAELLEAIETGDPIEICEESGDVLFLLVMLAEIHSEKGEYNFNDVINTADEKLIRRHPHVFGDTTIKNEQELKEQWETIKSQEKLKKK